MDALGWLMVAVVLYALAGAQVWRAGWWSRVRAGLVPLALGAVALWVWLGGAWSLVR